MTEVEDSQNIVSESSSRHQVAKPKNAGKKDEDDSLDDLSNYSFDLSPAEIA